MRYFSSIQNSSEGEGGGGIGFERFEKYNSKWKNNTRMKYFHFVTTRSCSVQDHLYFCQTMKTLLTTDIVNQSGLIPPNTLPDHSILLGVFSTAFSNETLTRGNL